MAYTVKTIYIAKGDKVDVCIADRTITFGEGSGMAFIKFDDLEAMKWDIAQMAVQVAEQSEPIAIDAGVADALKG